MSKGSGLTNTGDEDDPIYSLDAELDFSVSDDKKTEIEDSLKQILDDIIYWGKQPSDKLFYGRYTWEIIQDLDSRYKRLEKQIENIEDLENEYEDQEY